MSNTAVVRETLEAPPTADQIASFRSTAADEGRSIEVTFPTDDGEKRVVVSPRGTVVLLNDVSEETFNQSDSAEEVASALPE